MKWANKYTGETYSIPGSGQPTQGLVKIKTYRDVFDRYLVHAEAKSLGPDGQPCSQVTRGLLRRHPVRTSWIVYIGKESNSLDQVQRGIIHGSDEVINEYKDERRFFETVIVPFLRRISINELARLSELDRRTLKRIRTSKVMPSPQNRQKLISIVERWLRRERV